ncbi:probably inactive leucine-rich repeat receptor-like protein kinase At3g28040 [Mercurialis annua]|uniref:probably inactive leucine-rich repeat receptor-like protein kinase At3g28040 n=1 Tax=Mercurialis annua TaxID=3986 RepID=UPI0021609E19|nr:probably inactive leucine-rich repeat receptor-like protein kinase At3g28040 [Mercurialis annua]
MSFLQFFLHFLVSSTFFSSCMANNEVPIQLNDDVLGLIVFKSHLNDPSSSLSSWSEDDDSPCSWKFLKCNPNGRVSHVLLDGVGLSGKLGKGLQKLQHLKVLSLSNNNFSGEISHDISLIPNLEKLNLSHNSLTGIIPFSFVNLSSSMKFLDLSDNLLSGPIPDNLFQNLFSLRFVSLSRNSFQGPLPSSLANCSSLNSINLSDNHFSELFSGIWSLSHLRTLDLSNNEFSESVPVGLSNLYNLKELHLHGNRFSGSLPVDIGLCVHLIRLDLSNNLFTGVIPDSVQFLRSLTYFNLSNNMFGGDFPQWIGKVSNLEYLDFSSNVLTGSLPLSISNLKSVSFINLCNNKLTGEIPATVVECSELSVIRLKGNNFNGSIPEGLFDLGLEEVDFSDNNLFGSIPPGSSQFYSSIQTLDLSRNSLTGNITAEMGLSSNLRYLNLSWNNLQSRIPQEVGYFQNLAVLDLRNSFVFGSIPGDICESGSLSILQLDGNSLVGPIPEEIGNCSTLYLLSLSHNSLSGPIPKSISKLNKLEILQLESNKLSGEIPLELGKLQNLLAVNISYNMLTGRLPSEGIFPSLDQSALQGNLGICSPLLKGPCKMNVPKPLVLDPFTYGNQIHHQPENESSESVKPHRRMLLSVSAIIAISASVFIVIGVVVISILNISVRKRLAFVDHALESLFSSSSRSGNLASTGKFVLFGTKSSSDDITNPESLLNKASEIGEGVFGTVYKVPLSGSQGSRIVAIKKLVTSNIIQNPEDFDREVRILGKAKHPNLVSLTGYYWTPQAQLLVSEFLPNGSLQAKLHGRLPSTPPLSWSERFKIVLGTAKGIAHLHHSFRPPIIHYNIKPNNILLDENNNPKISDFGLARLLTQLDKHAISSRFQSAYVAPELACRSLRVNEKCDVYGFGILILELVTGRRPIEYGEDNVVILNDHVRFLLEQGNALDCVDHSMGDYPEDEVLPVLKLALVCTSQIPSSRPSMAEVVQILQVIKTPVPQRMEIF